MSQTTRFAALSPTNQFAFTCPIFNVDVKMRQCMKLVEVTKVNQKLDVRKGCQACIRSSKCPADQISRMISFKSAGVEPGDYGSAEPVKGRLRQDILKRIAPVVVMDRTMNEYGVPDAERDLITTASARIHKMAGTAPGEGSSRDLSAGATEKLKRKPRATNDNRINEAAATGDLAAALG